MRTTLKHVARSPKNGHIKFRAHPERERQVEELADALDCKKSEVVREAIHRLHVDVVQRAELEEELDAEDEDPEYLAYKAIRLLSGGSQ